jgi:Anti-sigma factor NepR
MRHPMMLVPLDRTMQLPMTLAGGLRATFDDVVSSPLPDGLAVLMRQLHADRSERSVHRSAGVSTSRSI